MRMPMIVFALAFVLVLIFRTLSDLSAAGRPGPGRPLAEKPLPQRIVRFALPVYALLASMCLTSIAFGKPGLLPQYGAWLIVVLVAVQALATWRNLRALRAIVEVAALLVLAYDWIVLLPAFDAWRG